MYFLTSLRVVDDTQLTSDYRCFGYFKDKASALNAVKIHACSLQECYYNMVLIEEIPEGFHPHNTEQIWFKWEKEWVEVTQPNFADRIMNWAIG